MISSRYSEQGMLPADQMRRLLLQLGAADHIAVPQQTFLLQPSEKAASPWSDVNLGDAPQAGWTINDYSGAEFEAVVRSITQEAEDQAQMLTSMKNVASIVSSRWEVLYSRCLTATCTQHSGAACLVVPVLYNCCLWLPHSHLYTALRCCLPCCACSVQLLLVAASQPPLHSTQVLLATQLCLFCMHPHLDM